MRNIYRYMNTTYENIYANSNYPKITSLYLLISIRFLFLTIIVTNQA